jgi:uncharacterized protein (TIGR00266 family)
MDVSIEKGPSFAVAVVDLAADETVLAEGDAMTSMSGNVNIETNRLSAGSEDQSTMGKITSAVGQMMAGESFLVNHLTAQGSEAEVVLSPTLPGDIQQYSLSDDTTLVIQSTSYLGGEPGVALNGEWGGAKSFFGGEGLFMLRASGRGTVLLNAFGGIQSETVDGEFVVDTGHIVAFEDTLDFNVSKFNEGWISSWLSGEGLVCRFEGQGTVYLQSRAPTSFGQAVGDQLPPRQR